LQAKSVRSARLVSVLNMAWVVVAYAAIKKETYSVSSSISAFIR